ncbi:helix-hairpin-helix domain-containing protein [Actinomycetospora sp. CA-053990]|uniref:helix-hairpin-helix domain-containing protein n=1 Tax=Actinomycetospora sp. CA-053990 TaxID=3239891 RepID=UPI003D93F32A
MARGRRGRLARPRDRDVRVRRRGGPRSRRLHDRPVRDPLLDEHPHAPRRRAGHADRGPASGVRSPGPAHRLGPPAAGPGRRRRARGARSSRRGPPSRRPGPLLAHELRVGRPDLPRSYDDGGLVDLNAAPAQAIARTCGIAPEHAGRIVACRSAAGRFASVEDVFVWADLPYEIWDHVRDRAVVLGR